MILFWRAAVGWFWNASWQPLAMRLVRPPDLLGGFVKTKALGVLEERACVVQFPSVQL
jgi:hypothetical protein